MSRRGSLEDAVKARLTPLLLEGLGGAPDGYLEALAIFQGRVDPDADDPDIARVAAGRSPAILITTSDGEFDDPSINIGTMRLDFELLILIMSSHNSSKEIQARGDGISNDPGVYAITEDVHRKLLGWNPAVENLGDLRGVDESRLEPPEDPRIMYQLRYRTWTHLDGVDPDEGLDEYTTIRGRINEPNETAANPIIEFDHDLD